MEPLFPTRKKNPKDETVSALCRQLILNCPVPTTKLLQWISKMSTKFLGFKDAELAERIMTVEMEDELDSLVLSLFGTGDAQNRFLERLKERRRETPGVAPLRRAVKRAAVPENVTVYKKNYTNDAGNGDSGTSRRTKAKQREEKRAKKEAANAAATADGGGNGTKRHHSTCGCMATKHKLITNCLNCGRIVCEQEGPGNCRFCGHRLASSSSGPSVARAVAHRDKLLEFDKTSAQRTTVVDDQSDYVDMNNNWASPEERDAARRMAAEREAAALAARRNITVSFDFAGRKVLVDSDGDAQQSNTGALPLPATLDDDVRHADADKEHGSLQPSDSATDTPVAGGDDDDDDNDNVDNEDSAAFPEFRIKSNPNRPSSLKADLIYIPR